MELVNRERTKAGLAELRLSARLAVAARGHSYDMALRHYFSHQSADGVSPEQRIRGSGIDYVEVGENIYMEDYPDQRTDGRAGGARDGSAAPAIARTCYRRCSRRRGSDWRAPQTARPT